MGRPKRAADGGLVYHVLNRANARMPIFEKDRDYEAFEEILGEAVERMKALRHSVKRGCPYGDESWRDKMAHRLGLESTLRPHGRPKKRRNCHDTVSPCSQPNSKLAWLPPKKNPNYPPTTCGM